MYAQQKIVLHEARKYRWNVLRIGETHRLGTEDMREDDFLTLAKAKDE